ncbi:MAG: hypothetical protein IKG46_08350 [Solobacterium sp.]|nr:hypothetical protein [Solobacterium sp.]
MTEEKKTYLKPAICTQCGGKLEVDPSQEAAVCPFCGTPFIVEKAINNYNTINVNNTVHNTVHVQHGKKGIFQSATELINNQLDREQNAALKQAELRIEQQKIDMAREEKRRQGRKSFWKYVGLFFAWIYCFPAPLYFLLKKKEDMDPKKKKYIMIAACAVYALFVIVAMTTGGRSSSGTAKPGPSDTTGKTASTAFKDSSHRTVSVGDYTFEIPEGWEQGNGQLYYAERNSSNNEYAYVNFTHTDDMIFASDEELEKERSSFLKAITSSDTYTKVTGMKSDTMKVRNITANYGSFHSTIVANETTKVPADVLVYWLRDPSGNGTTFVWCLQSDNAKLNYDTDFRSIARSVHVDPDAAQKTPEPTPEAAPEPTPQADSRDFEEFKQKMDDLEAFFDSYVEFLKTYDKDDMSMLVKYADMLAKYGDAMKALDEIDESALTAEESAYYTEVLLRINQKNLEVLQYLQ